MAKKQEKRVNKPICEGISLSYDFYEQKEDRMKTLMLKGVIVYLLSMGSIGFYLSCFKIDYNKPLCHILVFAMSLLCASLYYRLIVENLGYLVLLVAFAGMVMLFRGYINSGFYAIVNITVDHAAQFFNTDIQKLYNEQYSNRYFTVTIAVIFIGFVLDVFLNVYISRRMQYVTVAFTIMSLNLIPLYLTEEPEPIYPIMLMVGISMAYIFKSGQHYSPQVAIRRNDNGFVDKGHTNKKKAKNSELFYVSDIKAMLQSGAMALCFVLLVSLGVNTFKPRESFNAGYNGNTLKEKTVSGMTTLLIDGWQGFFSKDESVGGMRSGRLGTVSSVKVDYQPDLIVTLTPYTFERIFLKNFVGEVYNPYQNEWTSIAETRYDVEDNRIDEYEKLLGGEDIPDEGVKRAYYSEFNACETLRLKELYEQKADFSAKGKMEIEYVDYRAGMPVPYYSLGSRVRRWNSSEEYIFYPLVSEEPIKPRNTYSELDLYVPEENKEAVSNALLEAGAMGTDADIIDAVINYFQDNIPYTIRPGKTPKKADFVNYFLTENRKGYCAHYASAATLMFRYMGIPARYVEGYAVDYLQQVDGDLANGKDYKDYYDGFNMLGETAVVSVKVTDADAHAWVEVYTAAYGWVPVDVTPASYEEEEVEDFWTLFADYMDDSSNGNTGDNLDGINFKISAKILRTIFMVVAALIAIVFVIFFGRYGVTYIIQRVKIARAPINDKLIYRYNSFRKTFGRKNKAFAKLYNYREQIQFIERSRINDETTKENYEPSKAAEDIVDILQKAAFSNSEITEAELEQVIEWINL